MSEMSIIRRLPLCSYFNIFRYRMAMALRRSKISHHPFVAYIEPTSYCNLRCPACPTGIKSGMRERKAISYERFCEIVDELSPYLFNLYFYNWGEPLLHKDAFKMIGHASQKGIKVYASSNLSMNLSDEDVLELVKSGLYSLKVGLDGIDQKTYGKYRRGGNFNLVVSNIEKIVKFKRQENSRTPLLSVTYHVFKHNEATVDDARKLAEQIGIDNFSVTSSFLPPENHKTGIEPPSNNSWRKFNQLKEHFKIKRTCSWLYGAVVHNPNGSVSPCCGISWEEDDFCTWSRGKGIHSVMNDPNYVLARKLAKNNKNYSFKVDEGMGFTRVQYDRSREVICAKCQVPYIWGRLESDLKEIVLSLYVDYKSGDFRQKVYTVLSYLLMGAPYFLGSIGRLITKKGIINEKNY